MNTLKSSFLLFFLLGTLYLQADNQPVNLHTDLLEYTDQVYSNGYLSSHTVSSRKQNRCNNQLAQIHSSRPVFGWSIKSTNSDVRQTAYRIIVSKTLADAKNKIPSIWDSGMVNSGQSSSVKYGGGDLLPQTDYFWRVKIRTNKDGTSEWSDIKSFSTASHLSEYNASYYPLQKVDEYPLSVKKTKRDTHFIDFGKAAFSQIAFTLSSDNEDSIYIHLGECLDGERVNRKPGGARRYQRHLLHLKKGTHTYQIQIEPDKRQLQPAAIKMPTYIGEVLPFRYCEVEGYRKQLTQTSVKRSSVYYHFDEYASAFQCSNDTLNQIWELCKYSIKATSFAGMYVDGDRERIPYEADALINQLCHYSVDREYSMARRTLEYLLEYPTWPTEWILQAVLVAWNDYMYTGDNRLLDKNYLLLKNRTLIALKGESRLISTTSGQTPQFLQSINAKNAIRDIVDWPHAGILGLEKAEGGEADGYVFNDYNTAVNAFHYEALKLMKGIALALNKTEDASFWDKESEKHKTSFNKTFFDKKRKIYVDGNTTSHASLHANMLPLVFGLVPKEHQPHIVDFIKSRRMACSVYGAQFLIDALYDSGNADYALSLLTATNDRSWFNMIKVSSTITLEAWDNKYKPNQDWNHAWGAVPANSIMRKLMGVEPLTPAFETVRIKPQIGSLKWAQASIPTIKGNINMRVENESDYIIRIEIPANMSAQVHFPLKYSDSKVFLGSNNITSKIKRTKDAKNCIFTLSSGMHVIRIVQHDKRE